MHWVCALQMQKMSVTLSHGSTANGRNKQISLCFNLNVIREQAAESAHEIVQNRLIVSVTLTILSHMNKVQIQRYIVVKCVSSPCVQSFSLFQD